MNRYLWILLALLLLAVMLSGWWLGCQERRPGPPPPPPPLPGPLFEAGSSGIMILINAPWRSLWMSGLTVMPPCGCLIYRTDVAPSAGRLDY